MPTKSDPRARRGVSPLPRLVYHPTADPRARRGVSLNLECRDYELNPASFVAAADDMPFYPPYAVDAAHYHNCIEIGICLSGSGELCIGEQRWRYEAGALHVIPAGVRHSQTNEGMPVTHWRYLAVAESRMLSEAPANCRREIHAFLRQFCAHGLFLAHVSSTVTGIVRELFEAQRRYGQQAQARLEAATLLLLTTLAGEMSGASEGELFQPEDMRFLEPIEPALQYTAQHYGSEIRVGDLARACAMSESYFRKRFERLVGQSPLEYVNRYRVHRAMFLLRNSNEPIAAVAERTGFSSVTTFLRNFQKYEGSGLTPSQWRENHANR